MDRLLCFIGLHWWQNLKYRLAYWDQRKEKMEAEKFDVDLDEEEEEPADASEV